MLIKNDQAKTPAPPPRDLMLVMPNGGPLTYEGIRDVFIHVLDFLSSNYRVDATWVRGIPLRE